MEIVYKKLEDLKPYENNPRYNDEAVQYVAKSIEDFGFKVPLVIDKNNTIVAGHTRYKASMELGLKEVPCIIADDLDEEQIKAFRLVDNKVSEKSEWNFELLDEELNDLDVDLSLYGFDNADFDINNIERNDLSDKVFEKYEIIIRCENELDLQKKYEKLTEEGYECTISTL